MPSFTNDSIISDLRRRAKFLKTTEVMEILDISRNTLCKWVRGGLIPAQRIGKDNRFDPRVLASWIEARSL